MKLSISLGTRGRPQLLLATVGLTLRNAELASTRILIGIDDDDDDTIAAVQSSAFARCPQVVVSIRPREDSRGEKADRVLTEAPADLYLVQADYTPILTPGFDRIVLQAASLFPDGIGCVYSPLVNASFPGMQGVTARLAAMLGFIYPPWFPYWFIDHWLDDVARMIGRVSFADINVECHAWRPPNTHGLRDCRFWAALFDAGQLRRRQQARSIIDSPEFAEPEWRKEILRRHHPLIEYRSMWANNIVRQQASQIEALRGGEPPDQRYIRTKSRAEKLLLEWAAEAGVIEAPTQR